MPSTPQGMVVGSAPNSPPGRSAVPIELTQTAPKTRLN